MKGRIGDAPCRANASKHVIEVGAQHQQVVDGHVLSPTQAQMLHEFHEPDSMCVTRGHG